MNNGVPIQLVKRLNQIQVCFSFPIRQQSLCFSVLTKYRDCEVESI